MKTPVRILGALVMIAFLATTASAATDQQKCDAMKSKASGKFFATCMNCLTKEFADDADKFDVFACLQKGAMKCEEAFTKADTKFGAACLTSGDGGAVCEQTDELCEDVWEQLR